MPLNRNITQYPINILQSYDTNTLTSFGSRLIVNLDYKGLEYLLEAINKKRKDLKKELDDYKPLIESANLQAHKDQYVKQFLQNSSDFHALAEHENKALVLLLNLTVSENWHQSSLYNYTTHFNYMKIDFQLRLEELRSANIANSLLKDAIVMLDLEAASLVLEQTGEIIFKDDYHFADIVENFKDFVSAKHIPIDKDFIKRKPKMINLVIKHLPGEKITAHELALLSMILSKEAFDNFCLMKSINLKDEKFQEVNLRNYQIESTKPLLEINSTNKNVTNLLLSRTYADDSINLDTITSIYSQAYNLHDISKKVLKYMAFKIVENDDFKIIFANNSTSHYNTIKNEIVIDTNFHNLEVFNILSVFLHESLHYTLFKIDSAGIGINLKDSFNSVSNLFNKHVEKAKNTYFERIDKDIITDAYNIIENNETKKIEKITKHLTEATINFINPASNYVGFNLDQCKSYKDDLKEFIECFKTESLIDFFMFKAFDYSTDINKYNISALPDYIFDNIFINYVSSPDYSSEFNRSQIIDWANSTFLPKFINENNLTSHQVHYITRIADLVNRGDHVLKEEDYNDFSGLTFKLDELFVEILVRPLEFEAAGICQEDLCEPLHQFTREHVIPLIDQEMREAYEIKLQMFNEFILDNNLYEN